MHDLMERFNGILNETVCATSATSANKKKVQRL